MAMAGTQDSNGSTKEEEKVVWVFGMLAEEYTVRVVWVVTMLIAGGISYAILRNGFTGPLLFAAGMVMFFGCLLAFAAAPGPDVVLEARLRVEQGTRKACGTVVEFSRRGGGDSITGVRLTVSLDVDGVPHQVQVKSTVEDALLANFGTGRTVHLLYDPADPSRAALDRQASPTYVS